MTKRERVKTILKNNGAADKKLVNESLALIRKVEKLGAATYDQKPPTPPYSPTIRTMQPGDST